MNSGFGVFKSFDGLSLHQQWWKPAGAPKAVIALIHGSFEHSGRYHALAEHCTQQGYAVYAFDLRGHGKSEGPRAFVNSFDLYVRDSKDFVLGLKNHEPGLPVFLFGHSAGGVVTLLSILDPKLSFVKGLILSSPALRLNQAGTGLAKIMSSVVGGIFPRLKLEKLNSEFLCRDPEVVLEYNNDPLVYKDGIFAGVLAKFIRATQRIQAQLDQLSSPFLLLHGSADHFSDISGSKQLYEHAGSKDKTFKVYDGFYHELFNEPEKQRVFYDITSWLDTRLYL
jgi:alpha-beta hydrolase superfamily lysophospholipase